MTLVRGAAIIVLLAACAADPPPAPTTSDAWSYDSEQMACIADNVTADDIDSCRLASWSAACKRFGKCPAQRPVPQ